jgi:hypothetical protein
MMRIPYKVHHLMYMTKFSCTCRKRIKWRKETKKRRNKTKQKKQKLDKMRSEKKK